MGQSLVCGTGAIIPKFCLWRFIGNCWTPSSTPRISSWWSFLVLTIIIVHLFGKKILTYTNSNKKVAPNIHGPCWTMLCFSLWKKKVNIKVCILGKQSVNPASKILVFTWDLGFLLLKSYWFLCKFLFIWIYHKYILIEVREYSTTRFFQYKQQSAHHFTSQTSNVFPFSCSMSWLFSAILWS
jgi:hypothetical protein